MTSASSHRRRSVHLRPRPPGSWRSRWATSTAVQRPSP